MNPARGWNPRHDPFAPPQQRWIASNLETGVTVFARDLDELAGEMIMPTTDARWLAQVGVR